MKYNLSFFNGSVFIEQSGKRYPAAWLGGDGSASVELSRGSVHTPIKHLAEFAASLPMHVDLLQ